MSEYPRLSTENIICEFWRNVTWEDVEDDVDRMMTTMLEQEV